MTHAEMRLIEEAWQALVDRLGWVEATRFVMLLDRRTGGPIQQLQALAAGSRPTPRHHIAPVSHAAAASYYDYVDDEARSDSRTYQA